MSAPACPVCGRDTSAHDRHVRFTLPDPVLALPERERTAGTWLSNSTAIESVMLQVPNVGAFVRALLPVHLTGDESVTFGVWLAIDPRDEGLRRVFDIWWDDARYAQLRLDGLLANDLAPWPGLLGAPVETEVRDVDETPYCVTSDNEMLSRVLRDEWDRERVLRAVADLTGTSF